MRFEVAGRWPVNALTAAQTRELLDSKIGLKNALSKVKSAVTSCELHLAGSARTNALKKLEQARDDLTDALNDVNAQLRRSA